MKKGEYRTDGREGFTGHMLKGGFFSVLKGMVLFYTIIHAIVFVHTFIICWSEETTLVEEAKERYAYACVAQDAKKARLFFHTCTLDKITKDKKPAWEAFARVVRKQQLCGEGGDCGKAIYIVLGAVVGVVGLYFILSKMQNISLRKIDECNAHGMYSFDSGIHGGDSWGSSFIGEKKKE